MEQIEQKSPRPRRNKDQILELRDQFEKSTLRVKEFCLRHHINRAIFNKWKSRYKSKPVIKKRTSGFATIDVASSSTVALFAEVKGIRIHQVVSASFLKELLG
ncbi:MAG: hypothetical protein WKF70_02480 [Chitinophagaceae bacterium]